MLFATLPAEVRNLLFARSAGSVVGLPEGDDPRVRQAAALLHQHAGVRTHLLSHSGIGSSEVEMTEGVLKTTAAKKGKTASAELLALSSDPIFVAGAFLQTGYLDAVVGGAVATTAHVIRAVLSTVGVQAQLPLITSCFLFHLREPTAGGEQLVVYADAGVVPQPTESQIPQIAALAAAAFGRWTGREPRVGFLSFSTHGSAQHPDVDKMKNAAAAFAAVHPDILSEGELQFDAAVVPEIARRKYPATRIAGRTNVFVFPDLDAGNISYKITQRIAGAEAWGPLLLGCAKPFSDLSRGATAEDIAHIAILTLALKN